MQRQNCGKAVINGGGGSFIKEKFFIRVRMEAEINDYGRIIKAGICVSAMLTVADRQEYILKEFVNGDTIYDLVMKDYVDYERSQYSDEWNFENRGIKLWSKTKEFIGYAEGRNR